MEVDPLQSNLNIQGMYEVKEVHPPMPKFLPVPLGDPSKELSQVKAKLINPSLEKGMKNLSRMKNRLLRELKGDEKARQRKLTEKAFIHLYNLMVGSIPHQEKFLKTFKLILSNEELGYEIEGFLDLYSGTEKKPSGEELMEKSALIGGFNLEENVLRGVLSLEKSLADIGALINTQLFSDYIFNPLFNTEHKSFVLPRGQPLTEMFQKQGLKLSVEDQILNAEGYYTRDNYFQYETHGFKVLDSIVDPKNQQQNIVKKVEYRIGIALPGSRVYETTFEVDFTPFLSDEATFKETYELFELFSEHFSKAEDDIQELENKINDEKLVEYLSSLRKEIPTKLKACVCGIANPKEAQGDLINDRTKELFHPKVVKSIAVFKRNEMDDPENIKFAIRLMHIIGMEVLNPKTFPAYFERIKEVELFFPDITNQDLELAIHLIDLMGSKKIKVHDFNRCFQRVEEVKEFIGEKLSDVSIKEILKMDNEIDHKFMQLLDVISRSKGDVSDSNLHKVIRFKNEFIELCSNKFPIMEELINDNISEIFGANYLEKSFTSISREDDLLDLLDAFKGVADEAFITNGIEKILGELNKDQKQLIAKYIGHEAIGGLFEEFVVAAVNAFEDSTQKNREVLAVKQVHFMSSVDNLMPKEGGPLLEIGNKIFSVALKEKGE